MINKQYEIIVVGAGHAGIEAALASARLGHSTLVITTNLDRIGYMSCNPAVGGLAKGHIVREIDVLGGEMGLATDSTCIQFKRLNPGKGPAVRGSRAQCDKDLYVQYMTEVLAKEENISLLKGEVKSLSIASGACAGVVLGDGSQIFSKRVIVTTGTFMNAVMHVGLQKVAGGRAGDNSTKGLSDQLKSLGFSVHRLKTGTPPRLIKESIDFSNLEKQVGDEKFYPFSYRSQKEFKLPQVSCYISYTNEKTHEIIRQNLNKSPIFTGVIEGVGPRYCPSIEDKVHRFSEKNRHQTFLEPEGLNTNLIYLQGISSSLPADVQDLFIKTIPGLENVKFARYGYAVEYDFIEPTQIHFSLETKGIKNLFLAGQINGTSGYEEAACQGFLAGINASRSILDQNPIVLRRDQAYTGVLIDDLITKGTKEPYRMFTSRAEHRLFLREDNVLERLLETSKDIGLVSSENYDKMSSLCDLRKKELLFLKETMLYPNEETNASLVRIGTKKLLKPCSLDVLLRRSEISLESISKLGYGVSDSPDVVEPVEIEIKYEGYIKRQMEFIRQTTRLENYKLSWDLNYSQIMGLSREEVEKLSNVRPMTIGQAQRISGVNPSAIQAIFIHLKGRKIIKTEEKDTAHH